MGTSGIPKPMASEYSLAMRMEAGVGEALALVLAKESTVAQDDVVDLVSGTLAVQSVPFLRTLLPLPADCSKHICTLVGMYLGVGLCETHESWLSWCPN